MGEIADALRRAVERPADGGRVDEQPSRRPMPHAEALVRAGRRPRLDGEAPAPSEPDRTRLQGAGTAPEAPVDEAPRRISLLEPELGSDNPAARLSVERPSSPESQQYRRIAFRLRDLANARGARSIVVLSAEPTEGKTTTACNLAAQLARLDHSAHTLLLDLDFHRASVASALGFTLDHGAAEVVLGEVPIDAAIHATDIPSLSILGLPAPVADVDVLLASPGLPRMIRDLEQRFDHVIIDSPPVLVASDAQIILRHAAAAILVTWAAQSRARSLRRALDYLPSEKLLGTLLNGGKRSEPESYGYGYGYGASARDGEPENERAAAAPDRKARRGASTEERE